MTKHTTNLRKKHVEELKLDALEQYDKRQNLEIVGILYNKTDNTQDAIDLAEALDAKLNEEDISRAHRLSSKQHATHTRH